VCRDVRLDLAVVIDDVEGSLGPVDGAASAEAPRAAPLSVGPHALPARVVRLDVALRDGLHARRRDVLLKVAIVGFDRKDPERRIHGNDGVNPSKRNPAACVCARVNPFPG